MTSILRFNRVQCLKIFERVFSPQTRHSVGASKLPLSLLQALTMLILPQSAALAAESAFSTAAVDAATTVDSSTTISSIASRCGGNVWSVPNPKGIVVLVHGMTQQGGCFSHLAQQLNAEGYTAVAMDLRGHGKWFHSVDGEKSRVSYPKSAQDLLALAAELRSSYPGLPIFGVGESVGAGVMTLAAGQKANAFDGIVLVSAGTRPHTYNPIMVT